VRTSQNLTPALHMTISMPKTTFERGLHKIYQIINMYNLI
jgi:hypothetical protein